MTGRWPRNMALPSQVVPIPLGVAGIDTRTDHKAVRPPALAVCENGSFRRPGAIEKRYGASLIGGRQQLLYGPSLGSGHVLREPTAISGAKALTRVGDRLLMETSQDLLAYDSTTDSWVPIGPAPTCQVTYPAPAVMATALNITQCDAAQADGLLVTAAIDGANGLASIRDADTGLLLARGTFGSAAATHPRCVSVGSAVCILWARGSLLELAIVSRTTMGTWTSSSLSAVTVASDMGAAGLLDAVAIGTRILVAYLDTGGDIKYGYVEPSGALDGSLSTETPSSTPTALGIAVDGSAGSDSGRFAIFWSQAADGYARMFGPDKTALFVATTIGGPAAGATQIAGAFASSTELHVFDEQSAVSASNDLVQHSVLTSAGVRTTNNIWRHSGLGAKPIVRDGFVFPVLVHDSPLQATYFIGRAGLSGNNTSTVAQYAKRYDSCTIIGRLFPGRASGTQAHLSAPSDMGDGQWRMSLLVTDEDDITRIDEAILDFGASAGWAEAGERIVGAGALSWVTDGRLAGEIGYLLWPEGTTAVTASGGSMTAGSTVQYRIYYERTWPDGTREQSTAVDLEVELGASDTQVTLTIPTLMHTNWRRFGNGIQTYAALYRATISESQTIFNRVGTVAAGVANGITDAATYVDTASDESIEDNEPDYLSSNVADKVPPPAARVIASGNGRVFQAGFDDPDEIAFTLQRAAGEAVAFSDLLRTAADPGDGPITGLEVLADSLVVFRERQIYLIGGDGPTNVVSDGTTQGGEFTPPRVVSDDVGCIDQRSIVRFPLGIAFQARKGIYLLGTGLDLTYLGAGVERELEGETVTSAIALSDNHEIRFTLESGKTLVYDYLAQAWSTWTIGGLSAVLWQHQWVVLTDEDGTVLKETPGTFKDDGVPFSMRIRTPWIRLAGMQGFHLFKMLQFLGEYRSAHTPLVRIAYDFEPAWIDEFPWEGASTTVAANTYGSDTPYGTGIYGGETDGLPATTVYQFQVRPSQPRAEAIRVEFVDQPVAAGGLLGEGYSLSELSLDIAVKQGPMRLGAEKSA